MTTLVYVHSPFLGPNCWRAVADALEERGWPVAVPSLIGAFSGGEPYMPLLAEAIWGDDSVTAKTVLIAHSGAGGLMPGALVRARSSVEAIVLVDALVAQPGVSWRSEAPAELTERLDSFTDCGLLPEWHRWFSAKLLRQILPDEDMCETFIEELPRVPASYIDELIPDVDGWPPARGAYLQLSENYDEDARGAAALGWLVGSLASNHLAMLTMPEEVASAIESLLEELGISK